MELEHLHKMERGWLLPYLLQLDVTDNPEMGYKGHGRWYYWLNACERVQVPEGDIPPLHFSNSPAKADEKAIQDVLRVYVNKGYWYDDAWLALVVFMLHGFGRRGLDEALDRIPADVRNTWYQVFNLGHLLRNPCDWSAHILQGGLPAMGTGGNKWAKTSGYFATPMNITNVMCEMAIAANCTDLEAVKVQTVLDPCCGTGSMLLAASNYSLRLYGQDIVHDLCLCAELNGWLWMPWLVYMPHEMDDMFNGLGGSAAPAHATPGAPAIALETDPERIAIMEAYREGTTLAQGSIFDILNIT